MIDTDVGTDDAVALVMALRQPGADVVGITTVAGNTNLDNVVQNTLYTVELCESTVPVFRGSARPLLRAPSPAAAVHGGDGLGDIGLPLEGRTPSPGSAVEALIGAARARPRELLLVALGPLTNLAAACLADPNFADNVGRCVLMGGTGRGPGNVTPVAEFNIWADPEAAAVVFGSGMRLTMVGWDACTADATFSEPELDHLRERDTARARFCVDIQQVARHRARGAGRREGVCIPDPLAMAVALDPEVALEVRRLAVAVETQGSLTRGQTVVDHVQVTGRPPNVDVVFRADRSRFLARLQAALD